MNRNYRDDYKKYEIHTPPSLMLKRLLYFVFVVVALIVAWLIYSYVMHQKTTVLVDGARHGYDKHIAEQQYDGYHIKLLGRNNVNEPGQLLQIEKNGHIQYQQEGYNFSIGHNSSAEEHNRLIPIGKDITGKGVPNLVVSEWTGGMHCCSNTNVFELGKELKKVAVIENGHTDTAHFENNPLTKGLIFSTYDSTFAYWNTSFAESPAPKVFLEYCDGTYKLASALMRKPAPALDDLVKLSKNMRRHPSWLDEVPSPPLWSAMLDLIYSGNSSAAMKLFDLAWPVRAPEKQSFLQEFKAQLATSPYAEQLELLNAGKPVCKNIQ